jgi:hypothetical protein
MRRSRFEEEVDKIQGTKRIREGNFQELIVQENARAAEAEEAALDPKLPVVPASRLGDAARLAGIVADLATHDRNLEERVEVAPPVPPSMEHASAVGASSEEGEGADEEEDIDADDLFAGTHWTRFPSITAVVSLDRSKLPARAIKKLDPKKHKSMRLCLMPPSVPVTPAGDQHTSGILSNKLTNLKSHFKLYHPELFRVMERAVLDGVDCRTTLEHYLANIKSKSPAPSASFHQPSLFRMGVRVVENDDFDPAFRKNVAWVLHLAQNDSAFSQVDSSTMVLVKRECNFNVGNRKMLSNLSRVIARTISETRVAEVESAGLVSFAFDFAEIQQTDFLAVTQHYVSMDWRLQSFCIDFLPVYGSHSAEAIDAMLAPLMKTRYSDRVEIAGGIADGASNGQKSLKYFFGVTAEDVFEPSSPGLVNDEDEVDFLVNSGDIGRCFAHVIKLIMDRVFGKGASLGDAKMVSQDMHFVHDLAVLLANSKPLRELFGRIQEEFKFKRNLLVLGIECDTRWEERFLAVQRYLRLFPAIQKLYHDCDTLRPLLDKMEPKDFLYPAQRQRLEGVERCLRVFHVVSKQVQSERDIVCDRLPYFMGVLKAACRITEDDRGIVGDCIGVREMKLVMLQWCEKYFQRFISTDCNPLRAAALSPCFAKLSVQGISDEVVTEVWCTLGRIASEKLGKLGQTAMDEVRTVLEAESTRFLANGSLDNVLSEQIVDPLAWWAKQAKSDLCFQITAPIARLVFSSVISTGAPERRFKRGRAIKTKLRNALSSLTLEALLVIRDWLATNDVNKSEIFMSLLHRIKKTAQVDLGDDNWEEDDDGN